MEMNNDIFTPDLHIPEPVDSEDIPISAPAKDETPAETLPPRRRRKADAPVLTIESGDEIETEDAREAAAWHEIHNAYRTAAHPFRAAGRHRADRQRQDDCRCGLQRFSYRHPAQRNDGCPQRCQ